MSRLTVTQQLTEISGVFELAKFGCVYASAIATAPTHIYCLNDNTTNQPYYKTCCWFNCFGSTSVINKFGI